MSVAKRYLLAVNFFIETNRMEPFMAVYFITFKQWNEVWVGIVSLVMNLIMLVFQTPAGDWLDKTKYKKYITAASVLVASLTTASVVWTSNFWIILVLKGLEGLASTIFLPALMSLLLGICQSREDIPQLIAKNEVFNKIGSICFTLGCGLIAYYLYPNIESMFYLLAFGGCMATIFLLIIPNKSINNDRARQLKQTDSINEEYLPITYYELLRNKNILLFAISTFIYHLANATIVPLVAQYISIDDPKTSMIFTSAVLLLSYFTQAITAQILKHIVNTYNSKYLLILAHLILPLRCAIISLLIYFWSNKYAICATQLLDGVGAGLYDTMLPIVVSKLTRESGRFGFTYGFIITSWRLGHGISYLIGETIVYLVNYEIAFVTHGLIGLFSLVVLIFGVHIPSYKIERNIVKS